MYWIAYFQNNTFGIFIDAEDLAHDTASHMAYLRNTNLIGLTRITPEKYQQLKSEHFTGMD